MKAIKRIFCVVSCAAVLGGAVSSAVGNGCDKESNDRISATLALCSTHAYNIGSMTNPTTADERQLMRDVVALKTTVITQQMYSQYVYLDAMVRRLKTQLEKAVLTTSLAAAGATTDEGSSSYRSSSMQRNMYIAGAQNCNNPIGSLEVFSCLQSNYTQISAQTSGGTRPTSEARSQLAADYKIACNDITKNKPTNCTGDVLEMCTDAKRLGATKNFSECFENLRGIIRAGNTEAQREDAEIRGMYNRR